MTSPEEPRHDSGPSPFSRIVLRLAVVLFVLIGCLTIPKIAERMYRVFSAREARVNILRKSAGLEDAPAPGVRAADVLVIAAVAIGGAGALAALGYVALRRGAPAVPSNPPSSNSAE